MLLIMYGIAYMPKGEIEKFSYGPYFSYVEAVRKKKEINIPSYKIVKLELASEVQSWEIVE